MKKFFSIFFSLLIVGNTFAQKEIVHIYTNNLDGNGYVSCVGYSGELPNSDKIRYNIGSMISYLGEKGYVVEQLSCCMSSSNKISEIVIMSKNVNTSVSSKIQSVKDDPDEEVTEIARYNLQGKPIDKSEKGLQIIVFSNYTTKTVVVE